MLQMKLNFLEKVPNINALYVQIDYTGAFVSWCNTGYQRRRREDSTSLRSRVSDGNNNNCYIPRLSPKKTSTVIG